MSLSTKNSLVILISLALALSATAQNSPQDYLDAHNAARAQVGVDPLSWDDTLAAYAQDYANSRGGDCSLVHSDRNGGQYGENIAYGSSSSDSDHITGVDAVNMWVKENEYYDYNSNSCASGQMCGHYTQVVWRSTTSVGCGRTQCIAGGWFVICSYKPPGNFEGQRPY